MTNIRKHFRSLMENVDINYQPSPNSGEGLTRFEPTPADQVVTPTPKTYNVDGDFIKRALSWTGPTQAVDQFVGALVPDKSLTGGDFDSIISGFTTSPVSTVDPLAPISPEIPQSPIEQPPIDPIIATPSNSGVTDIVTDPVANLSTKPVDVPVSPNLEQPPIDTELDSGPEENNIETNDNSEEEEEEEDDFGTEINDEDDAKLI